MYPRQVAGIPRVFPPYAGLDENCAGTSKRAPSPRATNPADWAAHPLTRRQVRNSICPLPRIQTTNRGEPSWSSSVNRRLRIFDTHIKGGFRPYRRPAFNILRVYWNAEESPLSPFLTVAEMQGSFSPVCPHRDDWRHSSGRFVRSKGANRTDVAAVGTSWPAR